MEKKRRSASGKRPPAAKKRGRPALSPAERQRRTGRMEVRLWPAEREALDAAAEADGMETSTWLRELGLRAAGFGG